MEVPSVPFHHVVPVAEFLRHLLEELGSGWLVWSEVLLLWNTLGEAFFASCFQLSLEIHELSLETNIWEYDGSPLAYVLD